MSKKKSKKSKKSKSKKKGKKKFDLTEHHLVPKHIILTEEQKKAVLEKYNVTQEQLPKILKKDPMIKQMGAKVGDVVKIVRDSPTAEESVYYRLVVE